jgi:predicted pyridoxine 5'-phosphate oxidase superfamily flavin-nucleotide-binding protein
MAKLRREMKDLVEKKKACFVPTADKNGKTNVSPKGSVYGEINRSQRKGG